MDMPLSIQHSLLEQRPAPEPVKQRLQDIVGNPTKTAICFPSKAELARTNWAAFAFAAAWWFICFYTNSVVQVVTEVCFRSFPACARDLHRRCPFTQTTICHLEFSFWPSTFLRSNVFHLLSQHITKERHAKTNTTSSQDETLYDLAFEYLPRVNVCFPLPRTHRQKILPATGRSNDGFGVMLLLLHRTSWPMCGCGRLWRSRLCASG